MTREEALSWCKKIQNGSGPNPEAREFLLNGPVGTIAEGMWNQTDFRYGLEYGILIALRKAFDLQDSLDLEKDSL